MAVQPEMIGDVDEGTPLPGATVDEMGFTAEERAIFDGMRDDEQASPAEEEAPSETPSEEAPTDPALADLAALKPPVAPPIEEDDEPPVVDPRTGKQQQKQVNYQKYQRDIQKRETRLAEQ